VDHIDHLIKRTNNASNKRLSCAYAW
jgi:hypothetical protein